MTPYFPQLCELMSNRHTGGTTWFIMHQSGLLSLPLHWYMYTVHVLDGYSCTYVESLYQLGHMQMNAVSISSNCTTLTWERCFWHTHTHSFTIITYNIQYMLCSLCDFSVVRMWSLCLLLFNRHVLLGDYFVQIV